MPVVAMVEEVAPQVAVEAREDSHMVQGLRARTWD
jgi:hypothetical protein